MRIADGPSFLLYCFLLLRYHRQFIEVAQEYFLGEESFKRLIHSRMADYFLGLWGGGKKKPFRYPSRLVKKLVRLRFQFNNHIRLSLIHI